MKKFNQLSKGCQLCQQGKWLCIFLTYKCNSECHFCPAPFKHDRVHSALGNQKEVILSNLNNVGIEGISFSGGDPFIVFDRLIEWLKFFKKHIPDYYYWVYTNGLDVNEKKLEQLSAEGMDEIRFNIAATGYLSDKIWEHVKIARDLFPYITVEIPSISRDYRLLSEALANLENIGVDYLNLHDYILSETDNITMNETTESFLFNKVTHLKYALSSKRNTENIIDLSTKKGYHFQINHCSMKQKELQMVQRRLKMGKMFNDPEYDFVLKDGTICNFYFIPKEICSDRLQAKFVNPDFRADYKSYLVKRDDINYIQPSNFRIIKVFYVPQMEIAQEKRFIGAKAINTL